MINHIYLRLVSKGGNTISYTCVSYGTHYSIGDTIYLQDNHEGWQFSFLSVGSDLRPLVFLPLERDSLLRADTSPLNISDEISSFCKSCIGNTSSAPMVMQSNEPVGSTQDCIEGIYSSSVFPKKGQGFWIEFVGNRYKLYYFDLFLSQGLWISKSDTLVLHDFNLRSSFILRRYHSELQTIRFFNIEQRFRRAKDG